MHSFYTVIAVVHMVVAFLIMAGYLLGLARREWGVPPVMLWAARLQLLLGLLVVGLGEGALKYDYNHAKVAVKLLVALGIVACLEIARSRARKAVATDCFPGMERPVHRGLPMLVHVAFALTVLNTLIAFFWN